MRSRLRRLADSLDAEGPPDRYGDGAAVRAVEARIAELLGVPAALFVIKGVMAQQAVLRFWTDSRRSMP